MNKNKLLIIIFSILLIMIPNSVKAADLCCRYYYYAKDEAQLELTFTGGKYDSYTAYNKSTGISSTYHFNSTPTAYDELNNAISSGSCPSEIYLTEKCNLSPCGISSSSGFTSDTSAFSSVVFSINQPMTSSDYVSYRFVKSANPCSSSSTSTNGGTTSNTITKGTSKPLSCDDFVYKASDGTQINILTTAWQAIEIIAPIIVIILGMLDFTKATAASDDKAIKKAATDFGKRIAALIILFIAPYIISFILGLATDAGIFETKPSICIVK